MEVIHNEKKHQFELYLLEGENSSAEKKLTGIIEYTSGDGGATLYATSTEIFDGYRGKGYAAQLVEGMADYAEANNLKIFPVCPYIVKLFKRNPEKFSAVAK